MLTADDEGLNAEPKPCDVSIILPAYNGERHLRAAIQSVLEQSYANWELIVVDDGSTDNTAKLASEIAKSDKRIRYFYQANAGQANARNTGIRNSRGSLIAFIDQDDLWAKNKLKLQVKAIEDTGVDVVFSTGFLFVEDDIHSEAETFPTVQGKFRGPEMFRLLFMRNRIPILSALVRKEALNSVGLLDEDPVYQNSDDYDLWLRLAYHHAKFFGLPDKLVRYRLHSGQASKDGVKMLRAELAVLKKHELTGLMNKEERHERLSTVYDHLILVLADQKRFEEARAYMSELRARESFMPATWARACLLKIGPGYYKPIVDFVNRVRGSFSYRVGLLRNARRRRLQPDC